MPNYSQNKAIYDKYISKIYPYLMGEINWSIYRPDYSSSDNEPSLVASNIITRVDPSSPQYAEPLFSGVNFYSVFTNRNLVRSGDLLVYGTYNSPQLDRPYITYAHDAPIKEAVGFRSSLKGHLTVGRVNQDTGEYNYLYKNIWYDILNKNRPASEINDGDRHSLKLPQQQLVIYTRPLSIPLKSTIVEIDPSTGDETGVYWVVKQVDKSGALTILTVEYNLGAY